MPKVKGRIRVSRQSLERSFKTQKKLANSLSQRLANIQIANIHRRLDRGIGADDARMPDYAPSTIESRRREGRQVSRRDLQFKGAMRRDMHSVRVGQTSSRILFGLARQREKARHLQEQHEWFGISPNDDREIQAEIKDFEKELK